ncbi:hypothetical protein [Sphingomonas sp. F9_3S_D5_B_2]
MSNQTELQKRLDAVAVRCDLYRHHHRLQALSATEVAINPLPNVRALPPPQYVIECVRAELRKLPGVTLHGYPR